LEVLLAVGTLGGLYACGWLRLREQAPQIARPWRLAFYCSGLASICLALLSPIDRLASHLFSMHMIQHQLLMMVAPAFLLLADPLPVILWGLPGRARRSVGRLLVRTAVVRRVVRLLTWMPVAWFAYVITLWGWHVPAAYEAALRDRLLHDLEHLSFFGAGLLFWWPICNPHPRLHGAIPYSLRIVHVIISNGPLALLGLWLTLTERVLYPSYEAAPRLLGLSPLDDQAWGGIIMWAGSEMMYVIAVLVLLARLLTHEDRVTVSSSAHSREPVSMRSGS
jgi:cytochrome c oxidase assembly factor CtaG